MPFGTGRTRTVFFDHDLGQRAGFEPACTFEGRDFHPLRPEPAVSTPPL